MRCWLIRNDEGLFSNGRDEPIFVGDKYRKVWFEEGLLKAHVTRVGRYGSQCSVDRYAAAEIVEMELREVAVTKLHERMQRELLLREL